MEQVRLKFMPKRLSVMSINRRGGRSLCAVVLWTTACNDKMTQTTRQLHHSATVQARHFSLFSHIARMPDEQMLRRFQQFPWRTGRDHRDTLVLCGWRLSSRTWNPITSPWMKQLTWLRIVHSGDWCLCLVLSTPSGVC